MFVPPPRARAEVDVWYAHVGELAAGTVDRAVQRWLVGDEGDRYRRFHRDDDRMMFLLGRMMARSLVGAALGVPPDFWTWREGARGRPEIASPSTDLRFNLAHSAGLVACALARGRDVGVDVEDLQRRPVDRAVVRRYCAPAEVADIDAHGPRWHDRFLHYWTLKEAYLKARGLGIAVPLDEIQFVLENGDAGAGARIEFLGSLAGTDQRWAFRLDRPTGRHLLAVAASDVPGVPASWRIAPLPAGLIA